MFVTLFIPRPFPPPIERHPHIPLPKTTLLVMHAIVRGPRVSTELQECRDKISATTTTSEIYSRALSQTVCTLGSLQVCGG